MTRARIVSVFGRIGARRRRALVCRDAVALMTDYLDGTLPPADRRRLEAHLAGCPLCTEYLAQLRVTITALGRVDPADVPEDTVDELVALYQRWKDEGTAADEATGA